MSLDPKASPKAIYSFVVDGDPRFANQTHIFLTTLLAAGVSPHDIVAQVTPSVVPVMRSMIAGFGVRQVALHPILDRAYCNKIAQYDALLDTDADFIILCDTDLAFLDDLRSLFDPDAVRAKPVDLPNPPLAVLEQIRAAMGIATEPRIVPTDCKPSAYTYATNCNGGLYIIPRAHLASIAAHILPETQAIADHIDLLGQWAIHLDQVGFAMTMLRLGLDVREIPGAYNFPMHLPSTSWPAVTEPPKVLHYHWLTDARGLVKTVGDPMVDHAVQEVNRLL